MQGGKLRKRREPFAEASPPALVHDHRLARRAERDAGGRLLARGDAAQARPLAEEAFALRSGALSPQHPLLLLTRLLLAQVELQQGNPEAARGHLAQVEDAFATTTSPPVSLRASLLDTRARFAQHARDPQARVAALRAAVRSVGR